MTIDPTEAARALRSIPSEARAEASRINGKKGGRPKGTPQSEATKQKIRQTIARRKAEKETGENGTNTVL